MRSKAQIEAQHVEPGPIVADVVGPHQFSRYRWVLPSRLDHPSRWHYGIRRQTANRGSLRVDMSTVDEPLRELVALMHERQICTLPSCAGHHGQAPDRVRQAAEDLARQERQICEGGLEVTDVEDGSSYTLLNPDWKSPTHGRLLAGVRHWEGVGYAGATFAPGELTREPTISTRASKVQLVRGSQQDVLHLWVQTPDPGSQDRAWRDLSKDIIRYIDESRG